MSREEVLFMKNNYKSVYGLHIKGFIDMKVKMGCRYRTFSSIFNQLDDVADQADETSPGITKEFAKKWSQRLPNEGEHYWYRRVRFLAQFSSYLCDIGIHSYIPKLPPCPKITFTPYIYSQKEIELIFSICDGLRLQKITMKSCLICFPALIRLLYSTGLRISEALALKNQDVNLEENYLLIRDNKNGKERIIPIAESLANVLKEYVDYKDRYPLRKTRTGYFFVKLNGRECNSNSIHVKFKECLRKAGIPHIGKGQGPRLHDLRHSFAVYSLAGMAEAGIDLYASLPVLSNYLGHQTIDSTNHYVRLTSNMFPDLLKDIDAVCLDVFPKFKNYETD